MHSATAPTTIALLIEVYEQTKTLETTVAELQSDGASLPPLMNPTMLEASDDLTNLSHLNEPAGMSPAIPRSTSHTHLYSLASNKATIPAKRDIHVLGHCSHRYKPLRQG